MPRFFTKDIADGRAILRGADARHIGLSLRMRPGESVTICDGEGLEYPAVIEQIAAEAVTLTVGEPTASRAEPTLAVTLYQGLPKGDKLDWIIQKAVELGVSRVVPVEMRRSIARLDARASRKRERWQKIADEAAGQCGRGRLPVVEEPLSWKAALPRLAAERCVTFYEGGGRPLQELIAPEQTRLSILVGPEGGLAPEDVEELRAAGGQFATLGPRILRCETAPLAALTAAMLLTGNLGGV